MRISGFSMGKNISKLYYPLKESIESILPICDEFVIALGKGDENDNSLEIIKSIGSEKIRIIETEWDIAKYPNGTELAHQTDIAKSYCTGDWLFYIQADEVVHEKFLPEIKSKCEQYVNDPEVEGLLFNYTHFWADYDHIVDAHGWYKKEIRIIKNNPEIHSWRDAQSFRKIPNFDGLNYRQEENTFKLKVVTLNAHVYHYGWVRPPFYMKSKSSTFNSIFTGKKVAVETGSFDYGPLKCYPKFKETHPTVMKQWISQFNWKNDLYDSGRTPQRDKIKQEKLKYKFVTFLEKYVFFRPLFEFKNYLILKK